MANIEEKTKKIQNKFRLLKFTQQETARIINKNNVKALERHINSFNKNIDDIHTLISEVQELKIEADEELEEVRSWSLKIEADLAEFEDSIEELQKRVKLLKKEEKAAESREEEEVKAEARRREYDEALKLEEAKMQMKKQVEKEIMELKPSRDQQQQQPTKVKLPKLVISKFQGTYLDWQRFWNLFEMEIDKSDIASVSKFSYLKEALVQKVRATIDGLPLTTEGYERAKQILRTRYGKPSEVANAHIQNIVSLPTINGTQPPKILEFFEKLVTSVQTLDTMGKLKEINGYVRTTLDKLPGIRADLVRIDDEWQDWKFPQFIEALRRWCERNPVQVEDRNRQHPQPRRDKVFQTSDQAGKPKGCVYCENTEHKSVDCDNIKTVAERKKCLSLKKLCFNCTGSKHRAAECHSRFKCQKCSAKHHTSICDQQSQQILLATNEAKSSGTVTYPVVLVKVNGVTCRALLDTGAGSSYASTTLLDHIAKKPVRKEKRRIEMMMQSVTQTIEVYKVKIASMNEEFMLETTVSKVNKECLLYLPNPNYDAVISRYSHLREVKMDDSDKKSILPVHLILGANEYSRIKTDEKPKIGTPGEPIAEVTKFGWTIMSPGSESKLGNVYLTRSSNEDYEQLCSLDILGLIDKPDGDQQQVYEDFKEQLSRHPDGWYETGLLWKNSHDMLHNNKNRSLGRLNNLTRRLQREPDLFQKYDEIIQDQLDQGIVERVSKEEGNGKEYYIPHKPVIRETAESTKVRIVFDASAKGSDVSPSLNDCLEPGQPLQNLLWSVLVRNRLKPVALCGDLKQAFLQVRIREEDRDSLRFHWLKNQDPTQIEVLRFTRALFGLVQSPFLLGATIEEHLKRCEGKYPTEVEEIRSSLYVDDIISGSHTVEDTEHLKNTAISIFGEAQFQLHKWHSNIEQLETHKNETNANQSYAKEQLGVRADEVKMLGLTWNKTKDSLAVVFPSNQAEMTKRGILRSLASVYDPLGLASPTVLLGKFIYRECCDQRLAWDADLPDTIVKAWKSYENNLAAIVEVPRSLCSFQEPIQSVKLHVFGDTSGKGTSAAVYAVVEQESGTSQGLLTAKSRLAKKSLSIPRLELVAAHMASNLVNNVREALRGYPVEDIYGWLDSTVALYWIRNKGSYKQFVANRVKLINEKHFITWRHVTTDENPADIGSRGLQADKLPGTWLKGPDWLPERARWPNELIAQQSRESEEESKLIKEVLAVAVQKTEEIDNLFSKFSFWKGIRILSWMKRFIHNCTSKAEERVSGPLTTEETEHQIQYCIRREQELVSCTEPFKQDQLTLNLQKNSKGLYECRGRIQGVYPIYLPQKSVFSEKLVMDCHKKTLHGGVGLTMASVREKYWIPRLRQLSKRVVKSCRGCKRFHAVAFSNPPEGNLPKTRTEGFRPFQAVGIDYAGPLQYKRRQDQLGRPDRIYSDNGRTFIAGAKWLRKLMKDEKLRDFAAHQNISWQFNLSKAPWWGGQFERLIGLIKQSLYKTIGRAQLKWNELEEVILDVETALNNRPLGYIEDDIQQPILTPNVMMFGIPNKLVEEDPEDEEDKDMKKRANYLKRCKELLWKRWTAEYIRGLRERHQLKHPMKSPNLEVGDVVIIKNEDRNRGKWNLGIVEELISGKDGVVRGARLRAGKSYWERPIQHLFPLELHCDKPRTADKMLDPEAKEFKTKRGAAANATAIIRTIAEDEDESF
eukprot:gene7573-biopygen6100